MRWVLRTRDSPPKRPLPLFPTATNQPGNQGDAFMANTHKPDDYSGSHDDTKQLHSMGYAQELARRMSGFSNFAISFSIICILAGGITSFQLGFSAAGGASIGIGWPL